MTLQRNIMNTDRDWAESQSECLDPATLICIPPYWDNMTASADYATQYVNFFIYEKQQGLSDYKRMFSLNGTGQLRPNEVPYAFVHINKKPRFVGTKTVRVDGDLNSGAAVHLNWLNLLRQGETHDSNEVVVERDQNVTFFASVPDGQKQMFDQLPSIASTGNLSFVTKYASYGRANVEVYVQDSGGTLHGGDDKSLTATFQIEILPTIDLPTWQVGGSVRVDEDDSVSAASGTFFYRFLTDLSDGPDEFFQLFSLMVVSFDDTFIRKINSSVNYDFGSAVDLYIETCLLYTSPSPRDATLSRMPSSA